MKKELKTLEDFNKVGKLTYAVEFEKVYLLSDAKKALKDDKVESIKRLFTTNELIQHNVENKGDVEKFDEEKVIKDNYKKYSKEEKALYHFFKLTFKSEDDAKLFFEKNNKNKVFKSVSPEQIMEINATPVPIPNDAEYNSLWGLEKIKARDVWDCSKGCGVTVAVIDTGLDYNHVDINNNLYEYHPIVKGLNFTTDNGSNFVDPLDGNAPYYHGTHVSGTIAAEQNNLFGITGISPNSKIFPIKGLYNAGYGFISDLTSAIQWAASSYFNVKVINNSWGSSMPNPVYPPMVAAINFANSLNKTLVFAAGNRNMDTSLFFPQNHPDVIVVGATDQSDSKAPFSNYGSKVDVCAPGVQIKSLNKASTTRNLDGTSMAAPHVSGIVALIKSKYPNLDLATVRRIIRTYVMPYTSSEYLGTGRVSLEHLEEILCGCVLSPCKLNEIIASRELKNERSKKFKTIYSNNWSQACSLTNEGQCSEIDIPAFSPCFKLDWADSGNDKIETHDTETLFITVCNPYSNVSFNKLTISSITITPNQILPNQEESVDIIPSKLICYDSIAPCSCETREYALLTRNAAPSNYKLSIKYCIGDVQLLENNKGETEFNITLVNS